MASVAPSYGVVQLSSPPHSTSQPGTVLGYAVAGSSDWVAFKMRNNATGQYDIYSRRIDGSGDVIRITDAASTLHSGPDEYAVSPDGQYVVYESSGVGQFRVELYGRHTDGTGAPVRLTSTSEPNQFQPILRFLPATGHDLVWLWDGSTTQSDRLYHVPADGSAAERQVSPVFPNNGWSISRFNVTTTGARVIYHAVVNGDIEIYSSNPAATGGAPLKLNPTNFDNYSHFTLKSTRDEQRLVWTGDDTQFESPLMSRPLDASLPPVQIGAYRPSTGRQPFELSPDSTRAAYVSAVNANVDRLYSTPLDGSAAPQKLTDWEVKSFTFTPDSSRLVYVGDTDNDRFVTRPYSLFSRDVLGATSEQELYRGTSSITRFATVNNRVLFFGSSPGLWSVAADGSAPASEFARFGFGNILDFIISPDEQFVLLPVTTDGDAAIELLYAARTDGTVPPWRVNHDLLGTAAAISNFAFTPDSRTVIYQASDATTAGMELYATQVPEPAAGVAVAFALSAFPLRRRRPAAGPHRREPRSACDLQCGSPTTP